MSIEVTALFFAELGWFLFFMTLMFWAFWKMLQRKIIRVREENSLKILSLGTFIEDEGFDHNLRLYKFKFKSEGVKPIHIYSVLSWSTMQALYLSDEFMIVEQFYPFVTVREHKLDTRQYFEDPLNAENAPGIKNGFKRLFFYLVCFIPRLNDWAYERIDKINEKVTAIKVLEPDIQQEEIEYLYRVEYQEVTYDEDLEKYMVLDKFKELDMNEIEDLNDDSRVTIESIEPLYAVTLKEEEEEIEDRTLLSDEEAAELASKTDVTVLSTEDAYRVEYLKKKQRDSGSGLFTKKELQELKDDGNVEVISSDKLVTVTYKEKPKSKGERKEIKKEVMTNKESDKLREDVVNFKVMNIGKGPQFVTFVHKIKKSRKEVNLTKNEIDSMRKQKRIKIINVDETVQSKRVKSYRDAPELAIEAHISACSALAVQKFKARKIASEKAEMQKKLQKAREEIYNKELEAAEEKADMYSNAINSLTRSNLALDKVLENVFKGTISGIPIDQLKKVALRDYQIFMKELGDTISETKLKTQLTEVQEKIKDIERKQKVDSDKTKVQKEIESLFPDGVEHDV